MACKDRSTTPGAAAWIPSRTEVSFRFPPEEFFRPCRENLARDYGPCDYDIRHNLNAQYVYQLPVRVRNHFLGHALNGWQISGTVFWHSGVPFSVLSTPYSAIIQSLCGRGNCAGQRAAVRRVLCPE